MWLPAVLTVLSGQSRHPEAIVGVDAGSTDTSARILTESLGADRVIMLPSAGELPSFGASVQTGLASGVLRSDTDEAFDIETTEWVWLLHDDSAPASDCLEILLAAADTYPRAAILGPKALGWHDRRLLLELGFSITGSGRRTTGLERREHDQGQHDERSEVHAVGSAGMLIRRDAWDALDGFDTCLPLYRDDLDLCWRTWRAGHEVRVVPEAVIHHREASYHGRREGSTQSARGHRLDRRSALHVLLAQTPAWRLPFTALRLAIGSLVRSLVYLLGKDLRRAGDEIAAIGSIVAHPGRVAASRRHIRETSTMTSREAVHDLRPGAWSQARGAGEALIGIMASGRAEDSRSVGALESGPVSDDADIFDDPTDGFLRRALGRPAVVIALVLIVASAVAGRSLWWGDGVLFGGALLPSPAGAGDLWAAYTDTWHDVGPGSTVPAAPLTAILASLATLVLGKSGLMVGIVLFMAVPAAALSAWWSLRGVVQARGPRVWASLAYALLPAMTGAIATGRIGVLIAVVLLPPVVRILARSLDLAPSLPPPTGRTAWGGALLLALAIAGAPILWVWLVLAVLAGLVVALRRSLMTRDLLLRCLAMVLAPLALLLPWSLHVLSHPALFLADLGVPLDVPPIGASSLLLLDPGGPGTPAMWVTVGIVLAAVAAVLRPATRRLTLSTWAVALTVMGLTLLSTRLPLQTPSSESPVVMWSGTAAAVMGGALILAAAVASDGLRTSMSEAAFTWRQPVAGVASLLAVVSAALLLVSWLPGSDDPVRRADPTVLPPFVTAEAIGPEAPRTLILSPESAAQVGYALINGTGPTLGDAEAAPPASDWVRLDALVAGLVSGRGGDDVEGLAAYAVRYVGLEDAAEAGRSLARTLDSVPGLRRVAGQEGEVLWRVAPEASRVTVLNRDASDGITVTPVPIVQLSSAEPLVDSSLAAAQGSVRIAQTADSAWRATLDGVALPPAERETAGVDGALQQFVLASPSGGQLVVTIEDSTRTRWLWAQGIVLFVVIILALPGRRAIGDDDADDGVDADVARESASIPDPAVAHDEVSS